MKRKDIPEKYRIENAKGLRFFIADEDLRSHDSDAALQSFIESYKLQQDIPSELVLTDEEYWELLDNPNTFKVHEQ